MSRDHWPLSCVDAGTLELLLYKLFAAGLNTFDLVISLLNNKTANVEEKKERE
jgi:hypothetical protein